MLSRLGFEEIHALDGSVVFRELPHTRPANAKRAGTRFKNVGKTVFKNGVAEPSIQAVASHALLAQPVFTFAPGFLGIHLLGHVVKDAQNRRYSFIGDFSADTEAQNAPPEAVRRCKTYVAFSSRARRSMIRTLSEGSTWKPREESSGVLPAHMELHRRTFIGGQHLSVCNACHQGRDRT